MSALVLLATVVVLRAQEPAELPTFDVASVRSSQPDARYRLGLLPNGRLDARAATVERLILTSYTLHESQVVDGPDWLDSERFDILATPPDGAPVDRVSTLARIRALLRDRFGLRTHTESRELSVYALVVARADGRLGSGLHASTVDCAAADQALQEARARGEFFTGVTCRGSIFSQADDALVLRYGAKSMSEMAEVLTPYVGRMVVDGTGLSGLFDMEVSFSQDPQPESDAVSIVTAVQEQLGLRLQERRTDARVLVIDRVERPAPN
jgi:uncharacterized protein (TIGR03435 family)